MKKGTIVLLVVLVLVLVLGGSAIGTYNSIVTSEEKAIADYQNIEAQLQRRNDLIPNLISTVKGYMNHEKEVINSITESREKLLGATNMEDIAAADSELSEALSKFLVVVENYPDLKANENFIQLQDELAGTENRIATARRDYNDSARIYNTKIRRFPGMFIAGVFGFEKMNYFEATEGSEEVPNVSFE